MRQSVEVNGWLILLILYSVVNLITFVVYGVDKRKACRGKWRIPESTLLGWALCGGSVGALLAMRVFRHKTHHARFRYGVPVILALQVLIACFLYRQFV